LLIAISGRNVLTISLNPIHTVTIVLWKNFNYFVDAPWQAEIVAAMFAHPSPACASDVNRFLQMSKCRELCGQDFQGKLPYDGSCGFAATTIKIPEIAAIEDLISL
jgi:hypothetical protein